jgi:Rad3-related DNA helicase
MVSLLPHSTGNQSRQHIGIQLPVHARSKKGQDGFQGTRSRKYHFFDEAHNIDYVCIESLSVMINERGLEQATRSLGR